MKKIVLVLMALALAGASQAQLLSVEDKSGNDIQGDTLVFWHAVDTTIFQLDFEHKDIVSIKNNHIDTIRVDLARTEIDTITGTGDYFCWGSQCFGLIAAGTRPVWFANDPAKTGPGDYAGGIGFAVYLGHNKKVGQAIFEYEFYDLDNQSDPTRKVKFFVKYDVSYLTGLSEELKTVDFGIFPNPAENSTQIEFNKSMSFENQEIAVYDLLGKRVNLQTITSGSEKMTINTSEFKAGIYFVNVLQNDKVIVSKKLIVQ